MNSLSSFYSLSGVIPPIPMYSMYSHVFPCIPMYSHVFIPHPSALAGVTQKPYSISRPSGSNVDTLLRLRGRLLLDHEALSCLLVLLFVDEPKLNTSRLHRVLRNLCYHAQTRHWVIRSLLSILQRSSESELCIETPKLSTSEERGKKSSKSCASSSHENRPLDLLHKMESKSSNQLSWLSVSMDAALGCRTNIFQIQRSGGRKHTEKHTSSGSTVHIHPQAAPVVCRHVLDTLIQLAKVRSLKKSLPSRVIDLG